MKDSRAYDDFIDLLLANTNPALIVEFKPKTATVRRVEELLFKEKAGDISPDEKSELDHFMVMEHVIRLAKIRARQKMLKAA
ncbi:MAG: hypothetical protein AAB316_18755 [Bacteroidota bacterium]